MVEEARKRSSTASERLDTARFALRERQAEQREASGLDDEGDPPVGVPVEIKELDDVLVRDVGAKIKADGRWPLVIDTSGQASVFLRYLVNAWVAIITVRPTEMTLTLSPAPIPHIISPTQSIPHI